MKWAINSLMVADVPVAKAAVMVHFTLSDTQEGLTGQVDYSLNLLEGDLDNYTPYDEITEAQAIQWTKLAAGPERIASWEAEVQAKIDAQKIPVPQPALLPWASHE